MQNLRAYIEDVLTAVRYEDGAQLFRLLSVMSSPQDLPERSQFPTPSPMDLLVLPDLKWQALVENYLLLVRAFVSIDLENAFGQAISFLESLNRCAEKQDIWIVPTMINAHQELRKLYKVKVASGLRSEDEAALLEKLARVLSTSFQISLNDRNLDKHRSKRQGVYFFIGELFKVYANLGKFDLARSTEKLFKSLSHELPKIEQVPKSHAVTYLYFSGLISCSENNISAAYQKLTRAFRLCPKKGEESIKSSILLSLIPVKFLETRRMPSTDVWEQFPKVKAAYQDLFKAVKEGDLKLFDRELLRLERIVLKRQLYLIFMDIRAFVVLKLFKITWILSERKPHMPIAAFQLALEYSSSHSSILGHSYKYSIDASEAQVARLIAAGYIKGYLSHGNRVAVLSKLDPFPDQVV